MSDATIAERMDRYRRAQGKRGLVEVRIWVPEGSRDDLKAYARTLRQELGVGALARARPRKARKPR